LFAMMMIDLTVLIPGLVAMTKANYHFHKAHRWETRIIVHQVWNCPNSMQWKKRNCWLHDKRWCL
jgi:hypothetical protein